MEVAPGVMDKNIKMNISVQVECILWVSSCIE